MNYGGATINMIEIEDKSRMVKMIVPISRDNLERITGSLSVIKKHNIMNLTPHKAFVSVSREGQNKKKD